MDLLERGLTWALVVVAVVAVGAAALIWWPQLQRPPAQSATVTAASSLTPQIAASATVALATAAAPSPPTASTRTATPGIATPTPTARPASIPTARAEEKKRTPVTAPRIVARTAPEDRERYDVNPRNGVFTYSFTDIATAGSGAGLAFARTYVSSRAETGALGAGWTHSYAIRLDSAAAGSEDLELDDPTGKVTRYVLQPDGTYRTPRGASIIVARRPGGGHTASHDDGTVWSFSTTGNLASVSSRGGGTTFLSYDTVGRPIRISDPDGRGSLSLAYDQKSGRLLSVEDWLDPPRIVRFGYDASGRLASVTDREGKVTKYTYQTASHRLVGIVSARGYSVLSLGYDGAGRVASQRDARGKATGQAVTYSYATKADGTAETTRTYPASGLEASYHPTVVDTFDRFGELVRRVSKPGSSDEPLVEDFEYTPDGALHSRSVSGGSTPRPTERPATASGSGTTLLDVPLPALVKALVGALAKVDTLVHQEDAFGRITAFVAPVDPSYPFVQNGVWLLAFDREDRVRFVKAPITEPQEIPRPVVNVGRRLAAPTAVPTVDLELSYDDVGNLTEIREPDGRNTRFRYDERNLLVAVRISTGETFEYEYDDRGDPASARVVAAPGGKQQAADYFHDGLRRLRRVVDYPKWPEKRPSLISEWVYDGRGASSVVTFER